MSEVNFIVDTKDQAVYQLNLYNDLLSAGDHTLASKFEVEVLEANSDFYTKDDKGTWKVKDDAPISKLSTNVPTSEVNQTSGLLPGKTVDTAAGFPVKEDGTVDQSIPNQNLSPVYPEPGQPYPEGVSISGMVMTIAGIEEPYVNQASTASNEDGSTYRGNMSASPNIAAGVTAVNVPDLSTAAAGPSTVTTPADVVQAANNASASNNASTNATSAPAPTIGLGTQNAPAPVQANPNIEAAQPSQPEQPANQPATNPAPSIEPTHTESVQGEHQEETH